MKHIETIEALIRALVNSDTFHALVVESPPGLGKSTITDQALDRCGLRGIPLGACATPLHLYNTLCRHPAEILILDDVSGLFSDQKTMAILKVATWQSSGRTEAGSDRSPRARRISWGSTSEKVERPFTDFSGKLIILTNVIPSGRETEAFLSRCLTYRIRLRDEEVKQLILDGARSELHFPQTDVAREVAHYLTDDPLRFDVGKVSLRTLKMGYDLALTHGTTWRELLEHVLPRREAHHGGLAPRREASELDVIRQLLASDLSVKAQELRFIAMTGKCRRTFYNYKKRFGFTRSYASPACR